MFVVLDSEKNLVGIFYDRDWAYRVAGYKPNLELIEVSSLAEAEKYCREK